MSEPPGDREARIAQALAEYTALLEVGKPADRIAFLTAHGDLAAELGPLLGSIETLHRAGRQVSADTGAGVVLPLTGDMKLGEFRVVREIGRGGMGVVYEAVQEPLDRRVALKVLPAGGGIDPRQRELFLREARIAASLDHPHIVPVISVHDTPDGVQFYAMRFIDGEPLDAVVRALRRRAGLADGDAPPSGADLLATGLTTGFVPAGITPPTSTRAGTPNHTDLRYVRAVARLGLEAAEALQYAHEREIVHRDVKPGNLLLDVRGHLWLSDFGLALVRAAGTGSTTGARVGTLRYMSPEQAAGRRGEIDPRTDVYGLGATLYELLTLRPAFAAPTDTDLLRQIENTEPVSLQRLNPAVLPDLETVVLKAMQKLPGDRYDSARELAEDLRRFLGEQPVLARPLSRLQRLRRWAKRMRGPLVVVAAAVVAGVVLGLAASTYFVWSAYRAERTERRRVEERERLLLELIEQLNHLEVVLKDVPGAQTEQRALVLRAKEVLCRLADEPGAERRVKWEAYRACRRLAEIESRRGDKAAVDVHNDEAHRRIEELVREDPTNREYRLELARSRMSQRVRAEEVGGPDAALRELLAALELYERLAADEPEWVKVQNDLSTLYRLLSRHYVSRGELERALELARRGLAVDRVLRDRFREGHPLSYIRLAESWVHLGWVLCRAGDPSGAEDAFREAVAADTVVREKFEDAAKPRGHTIEARYRLGAFLVGRGTFAEAERVLTACAADAEQLSGLWKDDFVYRDLLCRCYWALGQSEYIQGREDDARKWFTQALEVHRTLPARSLVAVVTRMPLVPVTLKEFMNIEPKLFRGLVSFRSGNLAGAEQIFTEIVAEAGQEKAVRGEALYYLAVCRARRGAAAEARSAFDEAERREALKHAEDGSLRAARREAELALR